MSTDTPRTDALRARVQEDWNREILLDDRAVSLAAAHCDKAMLHADSLELELASVTEERDSLKRERDSLDREVRTVRERVTKFYEQKLAASREAEGWVKACKTQSPSTMITVKDRHLYIFRDGLWLHIPALPSALSASAAKEDK